MSPSCLTWVAQANRLQAGFLLSCSRADTGHWYKPIARFQQDVVREAAENGDILQHDIVEHPWNVTLLSINGLQWYMNKQSTQIAYVVQTRSDTFVDVKKWSYIFRCDCFVMEIYYIFVTFITVIYKFFQYRNTATVRNDTTQLVQLYASIQPA